LTSTFPTSGKITDMEDMNLKNKLDFLREHKVWKCMNKTEVLEEHSSSWMQNGLNSLKYEGTKILNRHFYAVSISHSFCSVPL
jgi:hypothetical protein